MTSPPSTTLPWRTLVQMTRPGFLVITAVACVLGTAVASACGHGPNAWTALATLVLAVLMHAAANVLNDYHDALNGADDANTQGLFPFTGGARLIQNGHVTTQDTHNLAKALIVFLIPCGLLLAVKTGGGLMLLGLAGLLLGWAYSAPPLAVKLLLEEGADPTLVNNGNASALDLAVRVDQPQSVFYIKAFTEAWYIQNPIKEESATK